MALQYLVEFRNGQDFKAVEDPHGEIPVIGSGGPFATASAYLFDGESVLFGRKGTIDRPRHENGRFWTVDTMFYTLLGPRVHGRWLYYWAMTVPFGLYSTSTALPSMTSSVLGRLMVPIVSLPEQRRIADFLDRETAEIESMEAELDRLVERLRERGRAVTESVLVDGFKDGVLKPLWSLLTPVKDQGHPTEAVLSVYRDYGVILKESRDDNFNRTPENVSSYQLVRPGDVVVNKMKAWQGSLGVSSHRGIISPDYQVCRPVCTEVDPHYLHLVLRSAQMIPQYGVRSKGIRPAQWRLYWEDMAHLTIPVPPLPEQRRIAAELDEQTSRIDEMVAGARQLKTLLAERRATLITEVVTGTKEVPA